MTRIDLDLIGLQSQVPVVRPQVGAGFSSLREDHWRTAIARTVLGRCLARWVRFEEAEPHLLAGYRVLDAERPSGDTYKRDALEYLVELYELWRRPADVRNYRSFLEAEAAPPGDGPRP